MLDLCTIAFNHPRAISEQIRLLDKHLLDEHYLTVVDNSSDLGAASEIERICDAYLVEYERPDFETRDHHLALNFAARYLVERGHDYFGLLDHDVYPMEPTRLIPLIDKAGFYGIGQRHAPTQSEYLWPGFFFVARDWLAGRELDFTGIRGDIKRDDGDTGSALGSLFTEEEWDRMHRDLHGYRQLRRKDDFGLQSWGCEQFGSWLHLTNTSRWMRVPNSDERERLAFELVASL